MHGLDILALMLPEPQGSGEASEESGVNIKNPENSPAIAEGPHRWSPLRGNYFGMILVLRKLHPCHLGLNG